MSDLQTPPAPGQPEKSGTAKPVTLWAQIVAACWIAGWTAAKFIAAPSSIDVTDVGFSGLLIAACFTPVYFSIILDKIKDIRIGK